jgi:ABC-type uncharacterized transport system permease subunit
MPKHRLYRVERTRNWPDGWELVALLVVILAIGVGVLALSLL